MQSREDKKQRTKGGDMELTLCFFLLLLFWTAKEIFF